MRGYACRGPTLSYRRRRCDSGRLHLFCITSSISLGGLPTTEVEKAYLAGLIDGEGSITLSRAHKNELPSPEVTITNTNRALVEWVKQVADCGIIINRSPRQPHHKPAYVWSIGKTDKCLQLLQEIRPYLRVKDRQADLLLTRYKASTPRNGKYTAEILEQKLRLVADIRALNLRCLPHPAIPVKPPELNGEGLVQDGDPTRSALFCWPN